MYLYKYSAALLILSSTSLTGCQPKADTPPEIFNTFSQSEFFQGNAKEIPCEDNADYPAPEFSRLCFQVNPLDIPNEEEGVKKGVDLGYNISKIFMAAGWTHGINTNPKIVSFQKPLNDICIEKIFTSFEMDTHVDLNKVDYPFEFAPILSFSKLRQPVCDKS